MADLSNASANAFVQLLREFQDAYAEFGDWRFWLFAYKWDNPQQFRKAAEEGHILGSVFRSEVDEWTVSAPNREPMFGRILEPAVNRFNDLARRGGAALPLVVSSALPTAPPEPMSRWLTFLVAALPPRHGYLEPTQDGGAAMSLYPFQESIEAIELCELQTNTPRFPPNGPRVADTSAFVPSKVLVDLFRLDHATLSKFLDKHSEIRTIRPSGRRRLVHAAEFLIQWQNQRAMSDNFEAMDEYGDGIESRKNEIQQNRRGAE